MAESSDAARDGLSSVTWGTLLMLLGTLGFVGEGFVSRVLLARTLTPVEWGQFSLGLALAGLLAAVGTLGLPNAVARSLPYAAGDAERRTIIRTALLATVAAAAALAAALIAVGLYVGARYEAPRLAETFELFAVASAFTIVAALIASVFQGYEDVVPNALFVQVVNPGLFIVLLVASFRLAAPSTFYTDALLAYLIAGIAALALIGLYARRRLARRLPAGPRAPAAARRLFLFAAPLLVVSVMGYLAGNVDTLLLGVYAQPELGYYTAALSLARLVLVGVGALGYIYLPVAARLYRAGDRESIRLTYVTATKWMVLVSLPLFLVFVVLPGASLGFVYGPSYSSSSFGLDPTLQLLVAGAFLATLAGPATSAQVALGQTRLLVYNTAVAAAVDIALSALLIPPMGLPGAAIAWAVATAAYPILGVFELALFEGIHPLERHYLVPVAATALPIGALLLALPLHPSLWLLPLLVLAGAGAYLLVIFVTGSVDRGDLLVLEVVEGMLGRRLHLLRRVGGWRMRHGPP